MGISFGYGHGIDDEIRMLFMMRASQFIRSHESKGIETGAFAVFPSFYSNLLAIMLILWIPPRIPASPLPGAAMYIPIATYPSPQSPISQFFPQQSIHPPFLPSSPPSNLNIPPPLLTNLLMRRALHRSSRVTLQAIELRILTALLGVVLARGGTDIAAAWCAGLQLGLLLRLGGLAAGVGGGHFA